MFEARREGYPISDDPGRLDQAAIGVYHDGIGTRVGFGRVVTGRTTSGWLSDRFVLQRHRGRRIARRPRTEVLGPTELAGFRRSMLAARDTPPVYPAVGFYPRETPDEFMDIPPSRSKEQR